MSPLKNNGGIHKGIFKSSFYSAKVEGNTLTIDEALDYINALREKQLPQRRNRILQIIRDHRQVSFDFVRRRFMAVSDRLLRYDLKKLQDAGFIKKRGVTKGAIYEPKF